MFLWPTLFSYYLTLVFQAISLPHLTPFYSLPWADALNFYFVQAPFAPPVVWVLFLRNLISSYFQLSFLFLSSPLCSFPCHQHFNTNACCQCPLCSLLLRVTHLLLVLHVLACLPAFFRAFMFLLCLEYSFHFPLKQMLQLISILFSNLILPFVRHHWNS